ncbi:MAG: hypothetical protein HYW89_01565 [Candidatus Sungiibacteriota bacterium]|uniref:Transcription regulator TrmB N-terminal domain-containing protein n=1 Tax=Candidatus Sungiibacteriota bacterium TaxID=2750080 RepID=A0A7T5RK11_9BACT|nr:MAG: hypothetical protein HYW89_01565 [Candidatus Sungbacteria bacterium]
MELETELKKIGLSEKEAKVYLAALRLGPATAADLARHAGVNRATTYVVIEKLKKEGLASSYGRGKKTYFSPEPPEQLKNLFALQEQRLRAGFKDVQKIFPELKKIYESAGERPLVRFFEGKEGSAAVRADILRSKPKVLDEIIPLIEEVKLSEKDKTALKKLRVPRRAIYTSRKSSPALPPEEKFFKRKLINHGDFPVETEIVLYGNKAALLALKKRFTGIIIEDEVIVKTLKLIFEMLWNHPKLK